MSDTSTLRDLRAGTANGVRLAPSYIDDALRGGS